MTSRLGLAGRMSPRRNVLSGNHAEEGPPRLSWLLRPSGAATECVSSVAMSFTCMPMASLKARYLPREIAPLFTGLSEEFSVSWRSLRSGRSG
jgi:hypothetical protein